MSTRPSRVLGIFLLFLITLGHASLPRAQDVQPVHVSAATAVAGVLKEIGATFTKKTGTPVQVTAGGSLALSRQILEGAPADIFVPEGGAILVPLLRVAMVNEGSSFLFAANNLVVAAPADRAKPLASPEDLAGDNIRSLAMADPNTVAAGIPVNRSLKALGLSERLRGRIRIAPDVKTALASVEAGEADLGIFYTTDVPSGSRLKVVLVLPPSSHDPISYPAALAGHPGASLAARPFLQFLRGPEARQAILDAGLTPPSP
jgi:molybdate transport system substrate-binding protein